jgi:hypothetical protein
VNEITIINKRVHELIEFQKGLPDQLDGIKENIEKTTKDLNFKIETQTVNSY